MVLLPSLLAVERSFGEDISSFPENKHIQAAFSNLSAIMQAEKESANKNVKIKPAIRGDIFGRKRRAIHPFITIRGIYSDNIYNDDDGKESDFITHISPGFWMSYPASRRKNVELRTSTMVPGGITKYNVKSLRRTHYRAYFLYGHDREIFAGNSSESTGSHRAVASYQHRFGKSTLSIADSLSMSHDKRGESGNPELNEYSSNILSISFDYIKSRKFRYNLGYSLFTPDYSNGASEFRSRSDSSLTGAVFYRIMPKTSILAEYRYIDISYSGEERLSGAEHQLYVGVNWLMTAKSSGTAKIGYGLKQFDSLSSDDHSDLYLSLDMNHKLSSRNRMSLSLSRRTTETNHRDSLFIISNELSLSLIHRYSPKTTFSTNLDFTADNYLGDMPAVTPKQEESNNTLGLSLFVDYRINRVFTAGAGYSYRNKKAEPSTFDYTSNEVFMHVSASL